MSYTPEDLLEIGKRIRMDLTNAQGKLTAVMEGIAAMPSKNDGAEFVCPRCEVRKATAEALADHLANVHGEGEPVREVA